MKRVRKILLIDDDEITCFLQKSLLEDLEVSDEIHCVHGGTEALAYLEECVKKETYPDLIFLDINMLGMDGFQFLEELKVSSSLISKIHIVMLTSSVNFRDVQTAASFGSMLKGYVTKPLQIGSVKEVLNSIEEKEE